MIFWSTDYSKRFAALVTFTCLRTHSYTVGKKLPCKVPACSSGNDTALPDQNTPRYFCAQSFHLVLCLRLPRQAAGGSAARTPRLVDELLCLLRRSHFNTKPAAANAPFFPQLNQHSFFKTDKKQNALITFTTFKNKHCRGSVSQDM